MSEKISQYANSVTSLASGDLMDVSKLISTSPDVYQSQKLNYSVLLSELNNDLSITLQQAYNASSQPQITTSVAKGGIVIRNGQALDTNSVLEIKNIAGSSTFVVGGNGIVANGDWQATAIAAAFGGTGQTSYAIGDTIYASNTTAIAKLGIGTTGQVLTVSGGGLPSWAAASNIGTDNLVIDEDARTLTLKSGGTSSQYFQIANDGGGNLLQIRGSKLIEFGSTSNAIKADYYLDSALNDQIRIFSGSSVFANFNPSTTRYSLDMANPSTGASIGISARYGQISVTGAAANPAGYYGFDSTGNQVITLDCQSDNDGYFLLKTNNTGKIGLYAGYGNYFQDNVSIGQDYTFTAKLNVKGAGSTSATQTALFQNSSAAAILTIYDDKTAVFSSKFAGVYAPNVTSITSSSTPTPDASTTGQYHITALAVGATFGAPTGSPSSAQRLTIRIKDNGGAQTLAFNAIYRAVGVTLPTTTVAGKTMYIGCVYNAGDGKWDVIALSQEA